MIKFDFYETREDGVELYRYYSDKGMKIKDKAKGTLYDEAVCLKENNYEFEETDIPIEVIE